MIKLHETLHERLDPAMCHEHYQPGNWVPHCTLATNVAADKRDKAIARLSGPMEPIDVIFDCADCVEFPPVKVLHQIALKVAGEQHLRRGKL